jgi:hypothetical protein
MCSAPDFYRDVRYEHEARRAIDEAFVKWPRAEDQAMLLEWIIVRDPHEGKPLTESGMTRALTLPGAISIGAPTVTFVYVIEAVRIVIKSVRFEDAKPESKATVH